MADPPSGSPTFPMLCPKCHACEGVPFRAGTVAGQPAVTRIEIRCHTCQHEWTIDVPAAPGRSPWGS